MSEKNGPLRLLESILLLAPLRVVLGALFVFAAYTKLSDPQAFAFAVKAFKILDVESADHVIKLVTFALPWAEGICGVLLILGLFTRPAAALVSVQLLAFIGAIISVLARKLEVDCGCFGEFDWPCGGEDSAGKPQGIGMCHIWRDVVLLIPALVLTWRGGGVLSLDGLRERCQDSDSGSRADSDFDDE